MAVNVTVRDIVNFPGGTAKTVTVDIIQIVPVAGNPEGDEIWVSSSTTTATASGGGSIENIFKNEMKRGFLRSSGLISGLVNIPASAGFKIAIDEDIGNGVDITVDSGNNLLLDDIAQDIETKIQNEAVTGGGGSKVGNLSYLNCQVRFVGSKFQIESGTLSDTYTGSGKSSIVIAAPDSGTDVRATLGLDITISSALLAARQIVESDLAIAYNAGGDILEVNSTAGLSAGDVIKILDDTNNQNVVISGVGPSNGLAASQMRFVTASGVTTGLEETYAVGSLVRLMHEVDVADPVSATATVDQLYRFQIDSLVNQIDFSA